MRVVLGLAFETKPEAPAFMARWTDSRSSRADTTSAGTSGKRLAMIPSSEKPLISGSMRSTTSRSQSGSASSMAIASVALLACWQETPSPTWARVRAMASRTNTWSSIIRIRVCISPN